MNGKPFPQWDRLLQVFGKGRATGEGSMAANEDAPPMTTKDFQTTMSGLDSSNPLDEEDIDNIFAKVINEVVDMPTPTGVRAEQPANSGNVAAAGENSIGARQRRPAARRIQLETSVSVLTNEISEIRPAIQQAIDGMVNRLLGEDDDTTQMRLDILPDLDDLPGLTCYQVIDAASTLSRDENRRDLQFFYRLHTVEDRLYFILHNILKV
ncbi:hypothetical protein LINPERPRIM_LOCUS38775 [Linum perenne]